MGSILTKIIIDTIIKKGEKALQELEAIAPNYKEYSNNLLLNLLDENKDTVFGKKYNFANIKSYEDYKNTVPFTDFSNYADLVDRISENNEQNILTKKPVAYFAMTSGTTSIPKLIPVVQESLDLNTAYTMPASFACAQRALKAKGKSLPREKFLALIDLGLVQKTKSGINKGGISGASVRKNQKYLEKIMTSPIEVVAADAYLDSKYLHTLFALKEKNLGFIGSSYMTIVSAIMDCMEDHWQSLCDDIEKGSINPDIEMSEATRKALNAKLKPDPKRANELREIFKGGFNDRPVAKMVWPKLSAVIAIGSGSFKTHTEKVKRFVGDDVVFCFLVIEASESLMAIASGCDTYDFTLVPQTAFYEFIPEDDDSKVYTSDQLEIGKKYELVLTTISGLCRYRMKDIVEVTGYQGEIPKIQFSHRANVFLNIAGEKTTEADLLRGIKHFEEKTGVKVCEYCAYPDNKETPGSYVILIEPDSDIDMNKLDEYADVIEEGLQITFGYRYERQDKNIDKCKLYIQQRQTHALYRELQIMKGTSRNQLKPVRVLSTPELKAFFTRMIEE